MKLRLALLCFSFALLYGCAKKGAVTGQTATLALKDGTTVTGTVTRSDTSSITIQTPSGVVSTYPMTQVSSVSYEAGPAAAQSTAPGQPPAEASSQPSSAPQSAPVQPAAEPPAASPQQDQQYVPAETFQTIPSGRTLAIRTDQTIAARTAEAGQTYSGTVVRDVLDSDGQLAIPRGSRATLVVREAREEGRVEGRSELALDIAAVQVGDRRYRLETSDFVEKGKEGLGANRRTAKFAGGGALFGTILGAVAGGGRGAAIGALAGSAAGAGAQGLTRGKDVRIPAEAVLSFRLEAPVRIRELR